MSSSKRKNKKPARRGNLKKARPRIIAVALNEAKAVKRLPSGPLPTPTASDDNETPALFKAPNRLGPVSTEPPGIATGMNDTDEQPTPNMAVTDGGVFRFWLCSPDATVR